MRRLVIALISSLLAGSAILGVTLGDSAAPATDAKGGFGWPRGT